MNLVEALDVALPELPALALQRSYPQVEPRIISGEHIERGVRIILAKAPGSDNFVRFTNDQWWLLNLFDGARSYAEIAQIARQQTGVAYTEDIVREFASVLQPTGIFYQTPLEKNITLRQKLMEERHKRRCFRVADVSNIQIHQWKQADRYLTTIQPKLKFIYTRWFVALTLVMFAIMAYMWADRFGQIWRDSFAFYNFSEKGFWDLVEFWILFGAMAFFHETAHGLTCKNFGGYVEKMGFFLMYFIPTFYCDVTPLWIYGGRKARLATVAAGLWVDLIICFFATAIWWGTATGMSIHDLAYKVMMVTGIGVTILNLNPLIKLDGYYMFSELLTEDGLKERATAYVSGWVKKTIFRLPVNIEYVPQRRRVFYIIYALLSGVYSYGLLTVVSLFIYHVLRSFVPDWAFVPALLSGYFVFRSRIRTLGRFMKTLYLDKRERVRAWFTTQRLAAVAVLTAVVLLVPVWPDFIGATFVLEPSQRAVLRAAVPGVVQQVLVEEHQAVAPGSPVVRLRNLQLETEAAQARAELQTGTARAVQAELSYADYGRAERERQQLTERDHVLAQQTSELEIRAPISGVVVTPRVRDLTGSYVASGTEIAEIVDMSRLLARIYVPEFAMRDVQLGAAARIQPKSQLNILSGTVTQLAAEYTEAPDGLGEKQSQLKGINPPRFYVATVSLLNNGNLKPGMSGAAKIFIRRRSLVGFVGRFLQDLLQRRLW